MNKIKQGASLWHESCLPKSCQTSIDLEKFFSIIPSSLEHSLKKKNSDFTRKRKLPLEKLIVFILSLVAGGRTEGVDIEAGAFFSNARRCGLWPKSDTIHRSALTKARAKVDWKLFHDILRKAVKLAYELWPSRPGDLWHNLSVYAIDGSLFTLPATDDIRAEFDPDSGLGKPGKGHFPQCCLSTLYDVFRRIPIARVVSPYKASERNDALELLPFVPDPKNSILIFDRGYPSYGLLFRLLQDFDGSFLIKCPSKKSFAAVTSFIKSQKEEDTISIAAPDPYRSRLSPQERKNIHPLTMRCIKIISPQGDVSVLLTNLAPTYTASEIINLYSRRWEIETYYRDEKVVMEIEKFHGKTSNSIRQELAAAMIMTVIARTMSALADHAYGHERARCQSKNAIVTLARDAAVLVADDPAKALEIFEQLLRQMARVKYYPPKQTRPPQPRIKKANKSKWQERRIAKITQAQARA